MEGGGQEMGESLGIHANGGLIFLSVRFSKHCPGSSFIDFLNILTTSTGELPCFFFFENKLIRTFL